MHLPAGATASSAVTNRPQTRGRAGNGPESAPLRPSETLNAHPTSGGRARQVVLAKQHAQDRLGASGLGPLPRDQIEIGVGLDQPHDHVCDLMQVDW
jgi:hypothetical protein